MMQLSEAIFRYMDWLSANDKAPSTISNYSHCLLSFCEYMHDPRIGEMREEDITQYFLLGEKLQRSPNTLHIRAAAIRSFVKYLNEHRYPVISHALVPRRKIKQDPIKTIAVEEVSLLLEEVLKTEDPAQRARDVILIWLMFELGLRVSEMRALKVTDFVLKDDAVMVYTAKSRRRSPYVMMYYPPVVREALEIWIAHRSENAFGHDYLIVSLDAKGHSFGQQLSIRGYQRIIKRLGVAAGLPWITPHILRHSKVRYMIENGAPTEDIRNLLRHATIYSTVRYTDMWGGPLKKRAQLYFAPIQVNTLEAPDSVLRRKEVKSTAKRGEMVIA